MQRYLQILLVMVCLVAANAYAALDLELTHGFNAAMPIAVVPFASQEPGSQASNNIARVIATDLANSGRFKVMSTTNMEQFPQRVTDVDYGYWRKQKQNNLVIGSAKPLGDGRYQVSFQLLDVFAQGKGQQADTSALLSQQFTVSAQELRALAHHISDLIYRQLTGDRGVFSTKISYVLVQRAANNPQQAKYTLEVADIDGYNPHTLLISPQPIMSPSWSPDGKFLSYVSFERNEPAIYIQDLASGSRRVISNYPGINGAPSWSPDGRKLALVLTKTGYPKIYILNLASGNLTQITDGWSIDTEPTWAPNGKSLAFTSTRGGGPQIYQVSLGSRQVQRITFTNKYNATPSFTPDGKTLIFLTQDSRGFDVAMQDLGNGRFTMLTQAGDAQSPSIAPNGKMVVYALRPSSGQGILGMSATDDSVKLRLPAPEGSVREPAWSPFLN
ncbi:MAG: Tol-Pal system beta propeller repeat protein TolB [Gammaproteobacteria bacterium]